MEILFEQLNPYACKTYLFAPKGSKEVVIVDPVLDHLKDYQELLKRRGLKLIYILETHTHADHISGAAALKDVTSAELVMHTKAPAKCPSTRVVEGNIIKIGDLSIKVLETPGHTMDSVSYILPGKILTGDALFLDDGGAGRDDLPGGDPGLHWQSLQKFLTLPEDLVVYPAHEYRNRKPSSLKRQKITNPHLKPQTKQDFIDYLTDLKLGPADWMKDVLKANYSCARDVNAAWVPVDAPSCEVKGTLEIGVNEQHFFTISPNDLKQKLDRGEAPLLLDVREPEELKGSLGQLEGVKNVPITKLIQNLGLLEDYKNKEIIVICRSGGRASTTAQIMKQAGFSSPTVLDGGMIAWREQYDSN